MVLMAAQLHLLLIMNIYLYKNVNSNYLISSAGSIILGLLPK